MKGLKVKRNRCCTFLFCLIVLCGCGGTTSDSLKKTVGAAEETQAETVTGNGTQNIADTADYQDGGRQFEILEVKENYLLVSEEEQASGLYTVSHGPVREDEEGNPVEISELEPGMIVKLDWDGAVMESYPAQFSYDRLKLTGRTGNKELFLYKQLIRELAEKDPGLNDGVMESYFDFTKISSLTEAEKEGLAYMGGSCFGAFGSQATAESLTEAGILDREKGIENGILVTIEEISTDGNTVKCKAIKFRSGTGAYYLLDIAAEYRDGEWSYTIGSEAIS